MILLLILSTLTIASVTAPDRTAAQVDGRAIRIEFDRVLHSRVVAKFGSEPLPLSDWAASEFVVVNDNELRDFTLKQRRSEAVSDSLGKGRRHILAGEAGTLRKEVRATAYDAYPGTVVMQVRYTNIGGSPVKIRRWTNHHTVLKAADPTDPAFWSFQGGSYESRPAWVVPLKAGFKQDNYQGMNSTDYGGGVPVADVWRRDGGIGVGHIEMSPKLVTLPVAMPDASTADLAVAFACDRTLERGQSLDTLVTFVTVHKGDYFETLAEYRRMMVARGIKFPQSPPDAFEPIWCAWGYRRGFTPEQIYGALPMAKKLGFRWVTLDDGWQTAEGDWYLNKTKFPRGDQDMKAMVDRIHADGHKAQLWWAPMSVDPDTDLLKKHPEQLLLNQDGSRQRITYWNAFYLCPAVPEVRRGAAEFVTKAIREWGFDGFKLDGQYMNAVPPCHNPAHNHKDPNESVEGVPGFFKAIFEAALAAKPDAVVEYCPCGTAFSFFNLPYMNMSVASDPRRSWQVRTKGKSLKALHGDAIAYFGDHVELSDEGQDFASTIGVGGVVGTEFTWPVGSGPVGRSGRRTSDLTPDREAHWAKWLKIYRDKMLSRGEYLGTLYDIGFDRPEAHAVRKDGRMYFSFFAADYQGKVELRGLQSREYRVVDYESGKELGVVAGPKAGLEVSFKHHLMLEASPAR